MNNKHHLKSALWTLNLRYCSVLQFVQSGEIQPHLWSNRLVCCLNVVSRARVKQYQLSGRFFINCDCYYHSTGSIHHLFKTVKSKWVSRSTNRNKWRAISNSFWDSWTSVQLYCSTVLQYSLTCLFCRLVREFVFIQNKVSTTIL